MKERENELPLVRLDESATWYALRRVVEIARETEDEAAYRAVSDWMAQFGCCLATEHRTPEELGLAEFGETPAPLSPGNQEKFDRITSRLRKDPNGPID